MKFLALASVAMGVSMSRVAAPGDGMDLAKATTEHSSAVAQQNVYHDVGCFFDEMVREADFHGPRSGSYSAKPLDISIVYYNAVVESPVQEAMTHKVCFDFCKTQSGMKYFGIQNGRDCYCTPHYKAGPGGSEDCDKPCDGNDKEICGGQNKSSIFVMHSDCSK